MLHTITMPDLGQTTTEGKIVRWLRHPGDQIKRGDALVEIETDKVTMEVESYASGYLRQLLAAEGESVSAETVIALVTDSPDESYTYETTHAEESPVGPAPPSIPAHEVVVGVAAPAARQLAKSLAVDLSQVRGTGSGGVITRQDVERHAAAATMPDNAALAAMATLTVESSRTIPHFYMTADLDMAAAEHWRDDWNESHPDLPATLNDIFVRSASVALRDTPALNVRYAGGTYEQRDSADVVLIVAVEGRGLVLVSMPDPSASQWAQFLGTAKALIANARQRRTSGRASADSPLLAISNMGMHGVAQFAAIIPPACTAVLAVGAVRDAAVVRDKGVDVARICTVTLSVDHRVTDAIVASHFMAALQKQLNSL